MAEPTKCMTVTNLMVFPVREPLGKTRAFVRAVLDDQLQITGMRLVEGTAGLFLGFPNDPTYKGEDFRSIFYPLTRELRESLEAAAIAKYNEVVSEVRT